MKTNDVIELYNKYVMKTYTRVPLVMERAKGSLVEDSDGKKYLDFFPGWAVSGIGHCNKAVVSAVSKQAGLPIITPSRHDGLRCQLTGRIGSNNLVRP